MSQTSILSILKISLILFKLDSLTLPRVGFQASDSTGDACGFSPGGESVLVNGAVFKTVSETVRTGSGRFDSYTPPPTENVGTPTENVGVPTGKFAK